MPSSKSKAKLLLTLALLHPALSQVTIYTGNEPVAAPTEVPDGTEYTGPGAYDPIVLVPPPAPQPPPPLDFAINLPEGGPGEGFTLSRQQHGGFFGFSIELSVADTLFGRTPEFLPVPFLNLLSNLRQRGGRTVIRVGGNTQEKAVMVPSLASGRTIEKEQTGPGGRTGTPAIIFTEDIIYSMGNITSLLGTQWFLGVPFNDTANPRPQIARLGQRVLGSSLLGLQVANEPDLYLGHQKRPAPYDQNDFFREFDTVTAQMDADPEIPVKHTYMGPSVCCVWPPVDMINLGFISTFAPRLSALTVMHYPANNCGTNQDTADSLFPRYLQHWDMVQRPLEQYDGFSAAAAAAGKPLYMLETNTASCGGFPGLSDSFGAIIWSIDWALTLAVKNFAGVFYHVGGQGTYYNPFTPPPGNVSNFRGWTVGAPYYAALVTAEIFGQSNRSQIVDLRANNNNIFTPVYAIYEDGMPTRVVLMNYMDSTTNSHDYIARIQVPPAVLGANGNAVQVRRLLAPSVSTKYDWTWANQTFGPILTSDGRLLNEPFTETIQCNPADNVCSIPVQAPSLALVFLSRSSVENSSPRGDTATQTFPTTAVTREDNTATINEDVLATSNGRGGANFADQGSTSKGSREGANSAVRVWVGAVVAVGAAVVGGLVVLAR